MRLTAVVAALGLVTAACGDDEAADTTAAPSATDADAPSGTGDYLWTMVTDQAGLGDQGFNDLAFEGLTQAADELGGEARVIESSEQAQYVPNLQQAVDDGADMTVGVGFLITDAIVEVAQANPDAAFVLIDAVAADADGAPLGNVTSVTFKEHEASYLAGIIAGLTTTTNRIGFAGGIEIPPVVRFLKGFEAGMLSVNPDATLQVAYSGSFDDPASVKQLAAGFYDSGADIVFEVAGLGGLGAYEEASERGEGFWVVGTDTCKVDLAPDNFLTSATKDVGGAVFRVAEEIAGGTFAGGVVELGLADDGVGVCEDNFADLPAEVQAAVEEAREQVASGEITVPSE
jgi:basic membrane protein A